MGMFDGMAAASFVHDAEGNTLIRPWGKRGKTYRVSDAQRERLARFMKVSGVVGFVLIIVAVLVFPTLYAFAVVPLLVAAYSVRLHQLTADLEVVDAEVVETGLELQARYARAIGKPLLWATLAVSVLFVALGIWMVAAGETRVGVLSAGFFGLCSISIAWQLRLTRE